MSTLFIGKQLEIKGPIEVGLICEILNPIEMKEITVSFLDTKTGEEFSEKLDLPKVNMDTDSIAGSHDSESTMVEQTIFSLSFTHGNGELYLLQGAIEDLTIVAE